MSATSVATNGWPKVHAATVVPVSYGPPVDEQEQPERQSEAEIVALGLTEWRICADLAQWPGGTRVRLRYESGALAGTVVIGDLLSCGTDTIRLHSGSAYTDAILPRCEPGELVMERLVRLT